VRDVREDSGYVRRRRLSDVDLRLPRLCRLLGFIAYGYLGDALDRLPKVP